MYIQRVSDLVKKSQSAKRQMQNRIPLKDRIDNET